MHQLSIGVMTTCINEKYLEQTIACSETWYQTCKKLDIPVYFFAGYHHNERIESMINLPNVAEDYNSAFDKQFKGLTWMQENSYSKFYLIVGTDNYININNLLPILDKHDHTLSLYIGGKGEDRIYDERKFTYLFGGAGIIVTNPIVSRLSQFDDIRATWYSICDRNDKKGEYPACDVTIAYFTSLWGISPISEKGLCACNYKGIMNNFTHCDLTDKDKVVICHYMDPEYMYSYHYYITSFESINKFNISNLELDLSQLNIHDYKSTDYTFVTAYYDLTDQFVKTKRDKKFYLYHGQQLLNQDISLIIYCDKDCYENIRTLRKSHNTYYIIKDFESFIDQELKNRVTLMRGLGDMFKDITSRYNVNYSLFSIIKYHLVNKAIDINPFKSSHFGWIDFGLGQWKSDIFKPLNEVIELKRDKFSCCRINITEEKILKDPRHFYFNNRTDIITNFFTGNIESIRKVSDLVMNEFKKVVNQGYGYKDEQVLATLYLDHKDLFDLYPGDTKSVIENYGYKIRGSEIKIMNCLLNCYLIDDTKSGYEIGKILYESFKKGYCRLDKNSEISLYYYLYLFYWYNESEKDHCLEISLTIAKKCQNSSEYLNQVAKLGNFLDNLDFLYGIYFNDKYYKKIRINVDKITPELTEELNDKVATLLDEYYIDEDHQAQIFVYTNDTELNPKSFITTNYVIRPKDKLLNIEYDPVFDSLDQIDD